jgi:DNA-binding NtrC family response regulator
MTAITVLIVDDEGGFVAPLSKRLTKRGFRTRLASSGREALDVLANETVDVTLLDIMMPGMDGIKTLGEIKRLHPCVEVLMLTAHADSDMVISCLAMGAYDYVMKPAGVNELTGKIKDAAERRKRYLAQDKGPVATTG